MALRLLKITVFLVVASLISCANQQPRQEKPLKTTATPIDTTLVLGANRTAAYLPLLQNKRVAVVGNPSTLILKKQLPSGEKKYTHLVDSLLSLDINVTRVFSPEHGFRGTADAGETVADGKDKQTGLPIISLYGKNKKPTPAQLKDLDIILFDIQDVGVRFYTYIATMHYVMQAAAEAAIPVVVLDRPNPNGHYVDGPIMEAAHTSFLGMHAGVPLVHGMTVGEYAQLINDEGWLEDGLQCALTVIPMQYYNHQMRYSLPVRPSPNLPNDTAINLYPSLGLLEGTQLNAGRGTEMQFQVLGSPHLPRSQYPFSYTPAPNFGSKNPKHNGTLCYGIDLRETPRMHTVDLSWIIHAYRAHKKPDAFFNTANFTAHAGTATLQQQIEAGLPVAEIHKSWEPGIQAFKELRSNYLLYPDKN